VYTPYASASPGYMLVGFLGIQPLPLHWSSWAHMVQAHVPWFLLSTEVSLTSIIHDCPSKWCLSMSVWVCGQISFHNGVSHSSGGVVSQWRSIWCCGVEGGGFILPVIGGVILILLESTRGVSGTVDIGLVVRLALWLYVRKCAVVFIGICACHWPWLYWNSVLVHGHSCQPQ